MPTHMSASRDVLTSTLFVLRVIDCGVPHNGEGEGVRREEKGRARASEIDETKKERHKEDDGGRVDGRERVR